MKKKKNKRKKIATILLILFFVLGLALLGRTFFVDKGEIAGEESSSADANIEELKNKIGSGVEYSVNKNTGALSFISAKEKKIPLTLEKPMSAEPTVAAKYFMQEYGKYFGLSVPAKELLFAGKKSDAEKMNHVAYVQKYKDIPVFGTYALVHLKEGNSVSSASAKFLPNIVSETKPKISEKRAKKEAEKYWEDWGYEGKPEIEKPKLLIFNRGIVENKESELCSLVYLVELWNGEKGGHEYFFINAVDGSLVYNLTGTRSLNRRIADGNSGIYVFARAEGGGATGVADVDNAYDYLLRAHNYFLNNFGRNGANNRGGFGDGSRSAYTNTDAYTRIDNVSGNVYSCPNSWYDYYSMKFCSGEMTSDILGHEYGHGVTYNSILYYTWPWGFDYEGESGAMDEGYADIFGELIENDVKGSADWQIGEDSASGSSRNIANPGSMNIGYGAFPGKMSDSGFYCGDGDYGGVHQNSTVFSHAAYLAAAGGTYNGYSISGVGTGAMGQIFYRALVYYLGASSAFEDSYNALNSSCSDLYGAGSAACAEVQKALQAVELNQANPCEGGSLVQITSDVTSVEYSTNKKRAKRRVNLSMENLGIKKKKHATVRIGGKKMKVVQVRNSGDQTIIAVTFKYRKWPRANYGAVVSYKVKVGKSWQRGVLSEDDVLSIF
jgi:bacillolysin